MWVFAGTIFLSAFLLFQIQPLIAKVILPWFGGAPNVWTTCMLFFQVALLGGYLYAHLLNRYLRPAQQWVVHGALLLGSLVILSVIPGDEWKPQGVDANVWQILLILSASIGLPYFLLSTTGPLVQAAFARRFVGRSPYRLFALSNLGSLLALISFPFLFEPFFGTSRHALGWSWGYVAFVGLCSTAMFLSRREGLPAFGAPATGQAAAVSEVSPPRATGWRDILWWLALSLVPSVMLLATTNHLCHSVAVLPFLWIAPLALYLVSFIICFEKPHWYRRDVWGVLMFVGMVVSIVAAHVARDAMVLRVVMYLFVLFVASMACHGELAMLRPAPQRLTLYYLLISVGGALGGIFVVLVAPLIFSGYHELPWSYLAASALFAWRFLASAERRELFRLALIGSWCVQLLGIGMLVGTPVYLSQRPLERAAIVVAMWLVAWTSLAHRRSEFAFQSGKESAFGKLRMNGLWAGVLMTLLMVLSVLLVASPYLDPQLDYLGLAVLAWTLFLAASALVSNGEWAPAWRGAPVIAAGFLVAWVAVGGFFWARQTHRLDVSVTYQSRDFFGVMWLREEFSDAEGLVREMWNGQIRHGMQYLKADRAMRRTTYFGSLSGVGISLDHHPRRATDSLKIGVIGLGTGSLAVYGRPGDELVFYEIKPDCERVAWKYFTYLSDNPAADKTSVVLGDARIVLERDLQQGRRQEFDVLVVDAFSGDSPPRHLLTREALALYQQHVKEDGIIAFNITNGFLELHRVLRALATTTGWEARWFHHRPELHASSEYFQWESLWVLVTRNQTFLQHPLVLEHQQSWEGVDPVEWTDDYGGLWQVFRVQSLSLLPAQWFSAARQ